MTTENCTCARDSAFIRLSGSVALYPGPTNIGIIERPDGVLLIDSGNDKEAGRKLLRALGETGRDLKIILNTHSNADHCGANRYLQDKTGCEVWATRAEASFMETPELEGSFLWGGFPLAELESKFFKPQRSRVTRILEPGIIDGLELIALDGHFFGMIGIKTADGVCFLADSVFGENILAKYRIPFIYDVKAFLETLEKIRAIEAQYFVPSHGPVVQDIKPLLDRNIEAVRAIEEAILSALSAEKDFESLLADLAGQFSVTLDASQFVLIGSTVKSFLSWLSRRGLVGCRFRDNRMLWRKAPA